MQKIGTIRGKFPRRKSFPTETQQSTLLLASDREEANGHYTMIKSGSVGRFFSPINGDNERCGRSLMEELDTHITH